MKLFEYLSFVKKRPEMYLSGDTPLRELENQIHGYLTAIRLHQIREDAIDFNTGLNDYIWKQYHWSTSCGWADAITRNSDTPEESINSFFQIANKFIEQQYGQSNAINGKDLDL